MTSPSPKVTLQRLVGPRSPARVVARKARQMAWHIQPYSSEPYATHMPTLSAATRRVPVRRVAEFGSGTYSTLHFLDRSAFPDVEVVVSYEDNAEWRDKVLEAAAGDPRLDLRLVPVVPQHVPADLSDFDLIFIDDSTTVDERAVTVAAVAAANPSGLVVVHDFQFGALRRTRSLFRHALVVTALTPQTGIMWNNPEIGVADVRAIAAMVASGSALRPTDTSAWLEHLGS